MKKAVGSLLTVLMMLSLGTATVTATGRSGTDLSVCTNEAEDYHGGIKVYAKDKGKGADRQGYFSAGWGWKFGLANSLPPVRGDAFASRTK